MNIIEVQDLKKFYIKSKNPLTKLRGALFGCGGIDREQVFWALKNVSLSVRAGECVGIIGRNGSGKSTLLKILSGISEADGGKVAVGGSVSALLEPGAGFNPEYSGIKNVYLSGAMHGISKAQITDNMEDILAFAEIPREFWELPVRTYSAGMIMRLGFSAMVSQNSDIILVDEALAVGDIRFQSKCFKRFEELKSAGKTVLFVSHDIDAVRRFCTRAVWLDDGKVAADGDVKRVTSKYMEACVQQERGEYSGGYINHYGSHMGSIEKVYASESRALGEGTEIVVELNVPEEVDLKNAGVSVAIKDKYGLDLCVFQTDRPLRHGSNSVKFIFENRLTRGEYTVAAGFEDRGKRPIYYYEYIEGACKIRSEAEPDIFGLVSLPCEIIMR